MNVMILVTHLLGTGHLARALTIARAFARAGDAVTVVSGGRPVDHFDTTGLRLVQLPPVQSNGTAFSHLLDAHNDPVTPNALEARRTQALATLRDTAPDVLITELFPFGRRILRDEFRAVLEAGRTMTPRPLILSSIRDILAPPGKPSKAAFGDDMIDRFYDGVLVHSDPKVVRLDRSWPISNQLAPRLHYTGFVAPPPPATQHATRRGVLVSAGGGNVGDGIFAVALATALQMPDTDWHLLVGGPDARRDTLTARAPRNVRIDPPRPDFRTLLQEAAASVSMCGYNTALDVLQTGVPAVLIPFDDGAEVEQGLRADALAILDGVCVLRQHALNATTLTQALHSVQTAPPRPPRLHGMDGATRTVEIAHKLCTDRTS